MNRMKPTKAELKAADLKLQHDILINQDRYYRRYDLDMTPEQMAAVTDVTAAQIEAHEAGAFDNDVHVAYIAAMDWKRSVRQ